MDHFDATTGSNLDASPGSGGKDIGVHGWLLVLCLMMTVVGPLLSVCLVSGDVDALASILAGSRAARWAMILSIASTTCAVVFGIHAGIRLWTIRPHAVRTARAALLLGLAVDVLTTTISTGLAPVSSHDGSLFYDVLMNLAPCLLFFTLCLAYLNRSERVEATYGVDRPAA